MQPPINIHLEQGVIQGGPDAEFGDTQMDVLGDRRNLDSLQNHSRLFSSGDQ
jgi:hypothetical protein